MIKSILIWALVAVVGAPAGVRAESAPPSAWPTAGWRQATPESRGFDSAALAEAFDAIRARSIPIHSLLIVRGDAMVLDAYFYPFADNQLHDLASVTKSVTSTLIGMAIGDGKLAGVDQPVLPLFPETATGAGDPRKSAMTLGDLLTMRSGLDCRFENGEPTLEAMRRSAHWSRFMLDLPMAAEPGSRYVYCSGGMHLLSAAISRASGRSALDYARQRLFGPLGIAKAAWPADSDGVSHGWGDLELQPRDLAKIGYLWLHDGLWGDQQIAPADYLRAATTPQTRSPWGESYGYGIWTYPERSPPIYEGNGRGGQRLTVIPSKDMVVVMTGGGFEPGEVGALIGKALRSDGALPANAAAQARLAAAIAAAARPPVAHAAASLPEFARAFAGRTYGLDTNPLGLRSLALGLTDTAEGSVEIGLADGGSERHAIGLDGAPRLSPGRDGRPVAVSGRWTQDALVLEFDQVGRINAYTLWLTPSRDRIRIRVRQREATGRLDAAFSGRASR